MKSILKRILEVLASAYLAIDPVRSSYSLDEWFMDMLTKLNK